ncbi:hypothetical protein M8J77_011235 [Diaphorina citri]|nr:hypothetical protein M8J77_011235 [Diaphorina citri]
MTEELKVPSLNEEVETMSLSEPQEVNIREILQKLSHTPEEQIDDGKNSEGTDGKMIDEKTPDTKNSKQAELREQHLKRLRSWINHRMTIEMTDGRVLVGTFLCTDRDANVILGSCGEYLSPEVFESKEENGAQEARLLGLVMVPGQHIVNILHDEPLIS